MSLDDRLPALGAAAEDPEVTDRSLRRVVARGRRRQQRRRATGSAVVVGVLTGGGVLAAASLGAQGDGSRVASGGGSTTVPAAVSGPHLWISDVRAAPGAVVGVALVAGPRDDAAGGLLTEVEWFGDRGWEHVGWASLCPPDLDCVGAVTTGERPAARQRAVTATAGSASGVLWLRLDGLDVGMYRLGMDLTGGGGRALVDFQVTSDGGGVGGAAHRAELAAVPGVVAGPSTVALVGQVEDGAEVTIEPVQGGAAHHAVVAEGTVDLPALAPGGYRLVVGPLAAYVWVDPER